jgi:hypothetical protein
VREYLNTPRMLCLGDVIGVTVEAIPLLAPVQTATHLRDETHKRIVFFKVTRLDPLRPDGWQAHAALPPAEAALYGGPSSDPQVRSSLDY